MSPPSSQRKYDKGERRFKHVGTSDKPVFVTQANPRHVIGKCPNNITAEQRQTLLNRAVPLANGDREIASPKKVYAVHKGAIYEAQTSDGAQTYHGYPFKGKLADSIIDLLRVMAEEEQTTAEFEDWLRAYIVRHGR